MESFAEGDLRIDVATRENTVVVSWHGKSNARDPDATLRPFFERVADEATRAQSQVEMRLHELEYFNSSTIAALIRAIRRLREQNTFVRLRYLRSSWQRRSFEALRVLEAAGAVEILGD